MLIVVLTNGINDARKYNERKLSKTFTPPRALIGCAADK